jgi:DNA-binding NarL/FixJ family response regulator
MLMTRNDKQALEVEDQKKDVENVPVASGEEKLDIVIIDRRPLPRHCLASAVQVTLPDSTVKPYATVAEWLAQASGPRRVSAVLLCSTSRDARDENLARDIALLTGSPSSAPVIVISDNEDPNSILEAFESGVRGYIPTTISFAVAVEAIRLVKAGGAYVPGISLMMMQRDPDTVSVAAEEKADGFTSRQTAVLRALREGKANKIIAYELNMRESTVKVHVRNIMRKLNARNRTEVTFKTMNLFSLEKAGMGSR